MTLTMAGEQLARFVHGQDTVDEGISIARVDVDGMEAVMSSQRYSDDFVLFADGSALVYQEGMWVER